MSPEASPNLRILLPLFALFATAAAWMASAGLPIARGDDAFYKAPGAELAATGVFASPSVTGYLSRDTCRRSKRSTPPIRRSIRGCSPAG
jgi:hypothetical protein